MIWLCVFLSLLQGPVTAWVEVQAARTMLGHLMLGCPLELYHPAELCCIYWYCDYLLNAAQVVSAGLLLRALGKCAVWNAL